MILGVILFVIVVVVAMLFYSALSWGFVASKFYVWFILPLFPMLPEINYIGFIGIMLFVAAIGYKNSVVIKDEYTNKEAGLTLLFISPWVVFACGWFVTLFI